MNRVGVDSENGLSPTRRQAIIQTNAVVFSMEPLRTHFNEISIKMKKTFDSRKCIWKYRLQNGGHFVQGGMSKMKSQGAKHWGFDALGRQRVHPGSM